MNHTNTNTGQCRISHRDEIICQGHILDEIAHHDQTLINDLIKELGAPMRACLSQFEAIEGRVPTEDELFWLLGEYLHTDPRHLRD